jgi:PleD family two-component response regulator
VTIPHPEPRPTGPAERHHPRVSAVREGAPDARAEIAGLRIIVVDDEPDARILVKRLLEDCGAVVTATGSADEAVRLVSTGAFDVLVSDIGMPVEDGYSLIHRARREAVDLTAPPGAPASPRTG